jgi:hypothetical protein
MKLLKFGFILFTSILLLSIVNVNAQSLEFKVSIGDKKSYSVEKFEIIGNITDDQKNILSSSELGLKAEDIFIVEITSVNSENVIGTITNNDKKVTNIDLTLLINKTIDDDSYWEKIDNGDSIIYDKSAKTITSTSFDLSTTPDISISSTLVRGMFTNSGWVFVLIIGFESTINGIYSGIDIQIKEVSSESTFGFELVPVVLFMVISSFVIKSKKII